MRRKYTRRNPDIVQTGVLLAILGIVGVVAYSASHKKDNFYQPPYSPYQGPGKGTPFHDPSLNQEGPV